MTSAALRWFPEHDLQRGFMSSEHPHYARARRHLSRRDPILKALIGQVGPCTLQVSADRFGVLVRSIVSQQISGKAAISISTRLHAALGRLGIHPKPIAKASEELLRAAGLSGNKMRAIRDLATKVLDGTVQLDTIHERADADVIEHLLP